jgi:chromosome segregation protein
VSEYLLNSVPVRLRDIQDLLRGTGLGSDAGVVIEAKMIDLLLSDRAEERRSLFEEAAGIGLYRDRKHSTERRLDETQVDLQRLEDLIVEVQSQIRSLARQKGRTERHGRLMEEKFAVTLTLARRKLDELAERAAGAETRHAMLSTRLPSMREQLGVATQQLESASRERTRSEAHRTEIARQLAEVQVALSRLEGDLAVATERLAHVSERRKRDEEERSLAARRTEEARREQEAAAEELAATQAQRAAILQELESRSSAEEAVRNRLTTQRGAVRSAEELLAQRAQTLRSLEGEHAALEQELLALRSSAADAEARFDALRNELTTAESAARALAEAADRATREAVSAADRSEQSRHDVAAAREQEATERNRKRLAEEALAQLTTRRAALEELERDRVGLAPGAAALLAERQRFNGSVLGPLSDYVSADRDAAELAERLLGEWMHAVLVRDHDSVEAIRRWHSEAQPGALVL